MERARNTAVPNSLLPGEAGNEDRRTAALF